MDSKPSQIWFGFANETCSVHDLLASLPAGGSECRHFSRRQEDQHQLQVFWHPPGAGAEAGAGESYLPAPPPPQQTVQQSVARFFESLEESDLSKSNYLGIIDLVQFWAPITGGGGGETILSVSEQPFGVRRLSKGVCRYRYDCIGNPCGDDGDPIKRAFLTCLPQCSQLRDYDLQQRYGVLSFWVLPLVESPTGLCVGVLEFCSTTVSNFEIHPLFTQSFLDYGSNNFARFCKNLGQGTSFKDDHFFHNHVPILQQNISDDFSWETVNVINESAPFPPYNEHDHINDHSNLNFGVAENEQIQEMVQQLGLEPTNGNNNATKLASTPRKGKRVPCDQLRGYIDRTQKDVANELKVSVSTVKRWCRCCGIEKWPAHNTRNKGTQNKGNSRPYSICVRARYESLTVRFNIDSTTGFECLCNKLGERFKLEVGSFRIEYEDENGDLIMIPCIEDLKEHLDFLSSAKKTVMDLIVSPAN